MPVPSLLIQQHGNVSLYVLLFHIDFLVKILSIVDFTTDRFIFQHDIKAVSHIKKGCHDNDRGNRFYYIFSLHIPDKKILYYTE